MKHISRYFSCLRDCSKTLSAVILNMLICWQFIYLAVQRVLSFDLKLILFLIM